MQMPRAQDLNLLLAMFMTNREDFITWWRKEWEEDQRHKAREGHLALAAHTGIHHLIAS